MIMAESLDDTEFMLTTVDNPFNPFIQFDEWLAYDTAMGYGTPQVLAGFTILSDDLSEADQALAIQQAISDVVELNASGMHRKVSRESFGHV